MTYSDDVPLFSDRVESDPTHILIPNMAWACGGDIVTEGGHIAFLNKWADVTCPDCLAEGIDSIRARTRRQQGKEAKSDSPQSSPQSAPSCILGSEPRHGWELSDGIPKRKESDMSRTPC